LQTPNNWYYWAIVDYFGDFVYILDMIVRAKTGAVDQLYFKIDTTCLVGFLEQGLIVTDTKRLAKAYMHSREFKVDICSLLPTDVLYFLPGNWFGLQSTFFLYKPLGKKTEKKMRKFA